MVLQQVPCAGPSAPGCVEGCWHEANTGKGNYGRSNQGLLLCHACQAPRGGLAGAQTILRVASWRELHVCS